MVYILTVVIPECKQLPIYYMSKLKTSSKRNSTNGHHINSLRFRGISSHICEHFIEYNFIAWSFDNNNFVCENKSKCIKSRHLLKKLNSIFFEVFKNLSIISINEYKFIKA
ncbi:hypothetical protein HMPREF2894_00915 [Rothia sp. HMSC066G02]|nr:hypothetical protein HMPREF2894_00915 [Rothia sp. HMSC066G02]